MGDPKYTPGPWRADVTPHGVSIRAGALGTRDAANSIAWLGDSNLRPSAENEANAHLMAAAPALLEALESLTKASGEALRRYYASRQNCLSGGTSARLHDANDAARAALAAARPDSPTPNTEEAL